MAVTIKSRSVTFTAAGDEDPRFLAIRSLRLSGTGLSGGLVVTDSDGSVILDTTAFSGDELLSSPLRTRGLKIATAPTGTFKLIAGLY